MAYPSTGGCRKSSCEKTIPPGLATERLCLEHFLDEAFVRTEQAFEKCQHGTRIDSKGLEWLLADALTIVSNLEEDRPEQNEPERDRMLELLLLLANVQEQVAHQSMIPGRLA